MGSDEDYNSCSGLQDVEDFIRDVDDVRRRRQKHYTILTEEKVRELQDRDILQVSSHLSVSRGVAYTLLRRHNWSVTAVFAADEKVRDTQEYQEQEDEEDLLQSYVDAHWNNTKWCPGPECNRAVQIDETKNYDVVCDCSHGFCWNCAEEIHRPVDCKTVDKWMQLKVSEAENTKWILAHTKPCPKCKRNIKKVQGGNLMTCRSPCYFKFCWLCLGPAASDYHCCNNYAAEAKVGENAKVGEKREREHLKMHAHYYERWVSNHISEEKAASDLIEVQEEEVVDIELRFVIEAWEKIVECRRVLKWSYAYGYYLCLTENAAKIAFFEFLQGQAEANLERLHHCAEKEMKEHCISDSFVAFKEKLVNLTIVTKNYFEELVRALENDLSEVTDTSKKSRGDN